MPTNFDLTERADFNELLSRTSRSASATSSSVEIGTAEAQMLVLEVSNYTGGTHAFQFEESDSSGSGFSQVADNLKSGDSAPSVTGTGDEGTYKLGYIGNSKYLRANVTNHTGTSAEYAVYSVSVPDQKPA